ncbi:adaptin domain protein, partial [Trichinella nativa]
MEKLDIMIRLASHANIAQVLAELKEYATEVDVDFVRKSVRAIGRCAIKVETSAERCVQTLLDLIQTKVNYVVQEAVVVIKDIFRKYPNKYESIISTLCENLDTLDEPEAKASMIWIIGEYAERIDNADELLESFLEGFADENTQVQLQLLTAIVKLFLKRPADTQQLVQRVLSLATQDSDNPDLRDRGYIYWRLLSADPVTAKEVVLSEKPLISEETDLLEPTLLDELICHIGSLASVYHKPPAVFLDSNQVSRKAASGQAVDGMGANATPNMLIDQLDDKPRVIPAQDSLVADLLNLDLSGSAEPQYQSGYGQAPMSNALDDLLGLGSDGLLGSVNNFAPTAPTAAASNLAPPGLESNSSSGFHGILGDIFGQPLTSSSHVAPKQVWLMATSGKGMEISGTFARRNQKIYMDLTFTNRSMQPLRGFAIQFNKNSGPVQKMDPLMIAVKNDIDIFYFSCIIPIYVLFADDGQMDKRLFLQAWKDIPAEN